MDRRLFLQSLGATALVPAAVWGALRSSAVAAAAPDPYASALESVLTDSPELATTYGLDTGRRARLKHRLDDRSPANRLRYLKALVDEAPVLRKRVPTGPRDAIFRATALWVADTVTPLRAFGYGNLDAYGFPVPYVVSQVSGSYQSMPDFLDTQHVIESQDDAEAYLDRLAAFAKILDQETALVRADAARGVAPPGVLLDRALAQLETFRKAQAGASAGLVTSLVRRTAAKGIGGDWQRRAQTIVDGPLAAAIARQVGVLQELRRSAREHVGVDALPQGEAFYAACLRYHTSTSLDPDAAHALGLAQVAALSDRARAVLSDAGMKTGSLADGLKALGTDPRYLFPNDDAGRAALLAYISDCTRAMYARLPRAFSRLPKTPLDIRRVPPEIELGSPGAYAISGSIDGSRPGAIYFNLHDTANWPRWSVVTTVYHEGVPGHHFQGSILNEATDIPTLFKLLPMNAYNEGWALYAEQLADELGAYDTEPLGRLGMLQASLFRACRIVVDTGLHARGWSREQAIAYLVDNSGTSADDARREIERYCSWPGQACGYKIGHLEILRQRERAQAQLGTRFDLKGFHDAILLNGPMPLEVMAQAVDAWIASVSPQAARLVG